ncbi:MAG: hypothetical protein ACJAR3_001788 [Roseivirga sp.]|jgi:hypothetical protein
MYLSECLALRSRALFRSAIQRIKDYLFIIKVMCLTLNEESIWDFYGIAKLIHRVSKVLTSPCEIPYKFIGPLKKLMHIFHGLR